MLLEAQAVSKFYRGRRRGAVVTAVVDASIAAEPGRFIAVVGESGSGKSTLARMLLGLIPPSSGEVLVDGRPLGSLRGRELLAFRRRVQAVLQDPAGSLNPRKTIGRTIGEVIALHRLASSARDVRERVADALALVGLSPADAFADRFPHELSGGQRQRVLIARAVALSPQIIVADEAVSALDASVKAEILLLLQDIQGRLGVGYVFITHDLPVVEKVAQVVHVMHRGSIVESGPTGRVFSAPVHPYTRELLAAAPRLDFTDPESNRERTTR